MPKDENVDVDRVVEVLIYDNVDINVNVDRYYMKKWIIKKNLKFIAETLQNVETIILFNWTNITKTIHFFKMQTWELNGII